MTVRELLDTIDTTNSILALERYVLQGGDVNAKHPVTSTSILHVAAEARDCAAVRFLVAHGACVNAQDDLGDTPLLAAVDAAFYRAKPANGESSLLTARLLVELGADQHIRNGHGQTPRDYAAVYR